MDPDNVYTITLFAGDAPTMYLGPYIM